MSIDNLMAYLPIFSSFRGQNNQPNQDKDETDSTEAFNLMLNDLNPLAFRERGKKEEYNKYLNRINKMLGAVAEMVQTEQTFVNNLKFIEENLAKPILEEEITFHDKATKQVFHEFFELWQTLTDLHSDLLHDFKDKLLKTRIFDPEEIYEPGDISIDAVNWLEKSLKSFFDDKISDMNEVIKTYQAYTSSYVLVLQMYSIELNRNKEFRKLDCFKQKSRELNKSFSRQSRQGVAGQLLAPIHRLTHYPLILKTLISALSITQATDKEVYRARNMMEIAKINSRLRLATQMKDINRLGGHFSKKKKERTLKLFEEERLLALMDNEYREVYMKDGVASLNEVFFCMYPKVERQLTKGGEKVARKEIKRKLKKYVIFLFNDLIMICQVKKSVFNASNKLYIIIYMLPLNTAQKISLPFLPMENKLIRKERCNLLPLVLTSKDWADGLNLLIFFKTKETHSFWSGKVDEALDYAHKNPKSTDSLKSSGVFSSKVVLNRSALPRRRSEEPEGGDGLERENSDTVFLGRKVFLRQMKQRTDAAIMVQKSFRGLRGRRAYRRKRKEMIKAAVVIQRAQRNKKKK
eukprot:snap_masked-scaffold_43-processed-gene-0.13-mRNA-1 protein AED:1.00 eAED:1.00 QI:0/0/0/0/1/1/2/0/577